jgi:hypothetical protein
MSDEHKRFTSEGDEELKHIREKKLKELMRLKEKKEQMSARQVPVTRTSLNLATRTPHNGFK